MSEKTRLFVKTYLKIFGYAVLITFTITMAWIFSVLAAGETLIVYPDNVNGLEFIISIYGVFFCLYLIVSFLKNVKAKRHGKQDLRTY